MRTTAVGPRSRCPRGLRSLPLLWQSTVFNAIAVASTTQGQAQSASAASANAVYLAYEAVDGCPSEAAFARAVQRRLQRARLASAAEADRAYGIQLNRAGSSVVGRLCVLAAEGSTACSESVKASSC